MWVTPAFAQGTGGSGGGGLLITVMPFILIFVIMYFLVLRPQRQQMKRREEMLKAIRRGDTIVTGGGLIGKVSKVIDGNELEVQLAEGVKVRALRSLVADVRAKGEPVAGDSN